jgi:hypothetical protein
LFGRRHDLNSVPGSAGRQSWLRRRGDAVR